METLESLKRRIDSAEDLRSIVKTMKALAAVSIRQYEKAVEALAEYNHATEMGLHVVLAQHAQELAPSRKKTAGRAGIIVFGSDQGMCGQFNEQIASYALEALAGLGIRREDRAALAVGVRVAARLEEAGQPIEDALPIPGSTAGITPLVQDLLLSIDGWRAGRQVERVWLFYNRLVSSAAYQPHQARLLPIDAARLRDLEQEAWPSRVLPIFTMDADRLLSALVRQHLFVSLYRAAAESLAGENAARLTAMQAAERNIGERLAELNAQYHQQRQGSITSELLDIVSGFEVLTGARAKFG
jgi:F-type H+-transporting ATPase subunit gamma